MAFIIKDRVKEATTTTGTGAISLSGAAATFDSFNSYMTNGDTTYYAIIHTSTGVDEWEVGIGTWNTGNTLSRTTVLAGSNGTSVEDFSTGTKDIFMTYPASKAVYTNVSGGIDINGGTIDGTTIGAVTASSGNFTTGDFTGDVDIDGKINIGDYADFDAQSSHPSHREGRLWYDNIHKTLNYHSEDSNVVHELGVEEHARVYNNSGATIGRGKPVYFSGSRSANGTHVPTIALANATEETKYKSEGMSASSIPNNSYGYIVTAGLLDGIDTSHLSVGQVFTGITDGATQTMPPVYPNFPMCLGFVVKVDSTEGVIFLAQQNHSIKTFRVQMDQHIGGDLTIDGNLNVTGTTSSTSTSDVTAGAPFYRANEGDAIGEAGTTFTGTGLDDAFFSGHYTGTATITYDVKIDGVGSGTGGVDTFAVSRDGFVTTFSSANNITGNKQLIHSGDNIYVEFGATTGHTLNDNWEGTASPVNVDTGFWTNRNTGTSGVGYTHMGIWYDASTSKWYLTNEYDPVPSGTINRSHSSYTKATLNADLEGNVTGNVTGALSGNATSATALETARTIGGVSFDGSANINLPGVNATGNQDTTGNAATATALETSRTIQLTGDVTGSATFDGSANASITAVVQDDSHSHIISNVDGLQTALDSKTPTTRILTAGNGLTGGGTLAANRTFSVGAGGGITVGADTVSHADTSSQASVNNSDGTVIQDITLDTYGHITGLTSSNLDSRFVNTSGDTITSGTSTGLTINHDTFANGLVIARNDTTNSAAIKFKNNTGETGILFGEASTKRPKWRPGGTTSSFFIFTEDYHPNADTLTTARTINGVSFNGSANITIADSTKLPLAGGTMTGSLTIDTGSSSSDALVIRGESPTINFIDQTSGADDFYIHINSHNFYVLRDTAGANVVGTGWDTPHPLLLEGDNNIGYVFGSRMFHETYHPNADKWTTARTLSLSGQASGSVSWDGSANATLSVTLNDSALDDQYVTVGARHTGNAASLVEANKASIRIWDVSTASDDPSSAGDGLVLSAGWDSVNWGIQQYHDFHSNDLYLRSKNNGTMTSWDRVFHDTYHPNADKWTTARTLSLSGDASGSVSWDGSANATLSVAVANDSHTHDGRYYTETEADARFTSRDHFRHTGQGNYTSTTTSALLTEALGDDAFDSKLTAHKTSWSYAGNGNLTDAGRFTELAGTSWLWWTDNSSDNVQGNVTALAIAPNTGGSAGKVFIYNNQGSSYNPGWREVWTSTSDGSGSGLDADKLDGLHASSFATSAQGTLASNALPKAGGTMTGGLTLSQDTSDVINFTANTTTRNRGIAFNGRTAITSDNVDGWLRLNNALDFTSGTFTPGLLRVDGSLDVASSIRHVSDSDTYMQFHENDQWRVVTGGVERLEVNNTTMTVANTLSMNGHEIDMNNNNIVGVNRLTHEGDTNTYIEFHTADQFRVVNGGSETQEWGLNYTLLPDNKQFRLGNSSDFRMFFNGTDTYFRNYAHAGGDMYFQGEGSDGVNETALALDFSGTRSYVKLYEDSQERLRTNSSGVGITGNLAVSGTVDGRDIGTNIPASLGTAGQVLTVNAGATAGEWAAPAAGGSSIGAVQLTGYFDSGTTNPGSGVYLEQISDLNDWMMVGTETTSYVVSLPADQGYSQTRYKFQKRYRSFS